MRSSHRSTGRVGGHRGGLRLLVPVRTDRVRPFQSAGARAKQASPLPGVTRRCIGSRSRTERAIQHSPVRRGGGPV